MNIKSKKRGFTIIELLTVMSIIVLLIGMLVPALSAARRYGKVMAQNAQFKSIAEGLEEYYRDYGDYPESDANDPTNAAYCGAMKLCEVMLGQDGMGFHPDSTFTRDLVADVCDLYPLELDPPGGVDPDRWAAAKDNLLERAHYLDNETMRASQLEDLYGTGDMGGFTPATYHNAVLCDAFPRVTHRVSGRRVGMPILYYKADTSKFSHDVETNASTNPGNPLNADNIYDYRDNHELIELGTPMDSGGYVHPLYKKGAADEGEGFYKMTWNQKVSSGLVPHNKNSYILISAGWDGIYGTNDDVTNFTE